MKVSDLISALGLVVYGGETGLNREIEGGYVSDLLSDVMGNADEGHVWVTLQSHRNVLAIASLKELAAVIIIKGYKPDAQTIEDSNREGVPLLGSDAENFEIAGKLYHLLGKNEPLQG